MKYVLIGGGENGHGNTVYETEPFDREIVRLTGRKNPNFLFIGAANPNPDIYFEVMRGIYGERFGCVTDELTVEEFKNPLLAEQKVLHADIIYVGGGNTLKMMKLFRKYRIDEILNRASMRDTVLCGVSAGAICWCRHGQSDARPDHSKRVTGLGFVDLVFCPHILTQPQRGEYLKKIMKTTYRYPAVAVDRAAIEIVDGRYRVLSFGEYSKAEKCFFKNGLYITEDINSDRWRDLSELVQKR